MNIMKMKYFRTPPSRMNKFLLFILLVGVNIVYPQTKSIALIENYSRAASPGLVSNEHVNTDSLIKYLTTSGLKTYDWQLDKDNSWEDLKLSLPDLKIAGISIYVSLMPPTNNSPSQPFGLDFINWAKEIANLSLRYSNIKGFSIKDFQENVNFNNFTQAYIDSVDASSTSINPKLQFANAGKLHHIFYVDKNANGNGDGTTWANAARTVHMVFAVNHIYAGDSIYVSGGSYGQIYSQDSLYNRQFSSNVVIAGAWQSGHNGRVTYRQQLPYIPLQFGSFIINECSHIVLANMNFDNGLPIVGSDPHTAIVHIYGGSYITIDRDSIVSDGVGGCVFVDTHSDQANSSHITVSNCYIEQQFNNFNDASHGYNQDPIWIGDNNGGNTIINNKLVSHSPFGWAHPDFIQNYHVGSSNNYEYVIANNLMIYDNDTSTYAQGIFFEASRGNRILVYNNIMLMNAIADEPINIFTQDSGKTSLRFFNNTINNYVHVVSGTDPASMITMLDGDTLIAKNNIYQVRGHNVSPRPYMLGHSSLREIAYIDCDYNRYQYNLTDGIYDNYLFKNSMEMSSTSPYDFHTWSQWNALGYDIHSDTGNVVFKNPFGKNISDYEVENVIKKGTNLLDYNFFSTDINGIVRPKYNDWEKGAIETK